MSKTSVEVSHLTVKQALHEILRLLQERHRPADTELRLIAAAIRKNTEALSSLSTYPPEVSPPTSSEESPMTTDPGQSVNDALVEQTQAISNLGAELADEHQQWLDAVAAGDQGQAQAIVDQVKSNTEQLNQFVSDLAQSHPGSSDTPQVNPL